jgi:LPS sulfotransferase NodH
MAKFNSYIICTSPRSGSTLLCKLLENSGVAGVPASYFHQASVADWAAGVGMPKTTPLHAIMDKVKNLGQGSGALFGLRLQRHSFAFFCKQLEVLQLKHATDAARLQAEFGTVRYIHLTREDKVEQAVSFVKAQQSGLWHKAPDGREIERLAPHSPPVFDVDAIGAKHAEFQAADAAWLAWFDAQNIAPLTITYGSLAADPRGALSQILQDLGCPAHAAQNTEVPTARLADETSREWIRRFAENKRA